MRLCVLAGVVLHAGLAMAESAQDVVVAGGDRALVQALGAVLAPDKAIAVDDPAPSSIGDLTTASRRIVEREHTAAAVWLITEAGTTTLVAYDRDVDRVLVRPLAYRTPLSDADAAAAARSARAMLRALRVEESAAPAPPPPPLAIVVAAPPPPARDQLATFAGFAVRVGAPGASANAELALGAVWRPRALGIALDVALAPASQLRSPTFDGSIGDRSASLAARMPFELSRRFGIAASAGLAVHAIRFSGASATEMIADWRFDPAVRVGLTASYSLGEQVDVGLAVSTDNLLQRQKYEVDGEQVVVMPRMQLASGVVLTVRLL